MNKRFYFVIGGPGCGKGTQCQKIVQKFNGWRHVSIGALLREEITSKTTKGIICQQYIDNGLIVPLEIVLSKDPSIERLKRLQGVLKEALEQIKETNFLIDGYPRDPNQIQAFEDSIGDFTCALFFDCPEEVLMTRLQERSLTSDRSDDNDEVIRKRLITFQEALNPVLEQLEARSKLMVIPASGDVDDVFEQTVQTIAKIL